MSSTSVLGNRKVLVTGANGFVGRHLCKEMLCRGWQVKAAVRLPNRLPDIGEVITIKNVAQDTDWTSALLGVDVVIHLAARVHVLKEAAADPLAEFLKVNLHGTINLAQQASKAGVKRLVYVSSIGVNGKQNEKQPFTEADNPDPYNAYTISKWQAEQALHRIAHETGLEVVIVRPPLVYGSSAKGNFPLLLNTLGTGIPLPLKSTNNSRSLIYVENLVDALITCAVHSAAAGQTYLVSDGENVSTSDLLRRLGAAMGRPARLFHCPPALLILLGHLTGKTEHIERLLGSLSVDSNKIRRELDWAPPYTLQQGLQLTAEWYRSTHP